MKIKVKKGDQVYVIAGKDKGKRGVIQKVLIRQNKVLITGINLSKHHLKPSKKNPHGGIVDMVAPIDASNVMVICPRCSKITRVGKLSPSKENKAGGRKCLKCQENLDIKE